MLTPDQINEIPGWFSDSEGRRLYELAAACPASLPIVEIGSYLGRSTAWLAEGSRGGNGAKITCIDPWVSDGIEWYSSLSSDELWIRFQDTMNRGGYWDIVTPIRATSQEAVMHWTSPIGLLFVDSVHEYDAVIDDWDSWTPFIAADGWAAFHDADASFPGVPRALYECWTPEKWSGVTLVDALWTARRLG